VIQDIRALGMKIWRNMAINREHKLRTLKKASPHRTADPMMMMMVMMMMMMKLN
jgi:hypothetical protein